MFPSPYIFLINYLSLSRNSRHCQFDEEKVFFCIWDATYNTKLKKGGKSEKNNLRLRE